MEISASKEKFSQRLPALIFLVLTTCILGVGYINYLYFEKQFRMEMERRLSAITDMKVSELVQWRKERLGDAHIFFKNDSFAELVERYLKSPGNKDVQRKIRSWLGKVVTYYAYDRVMLIDMQYVKQMIIPERQERSSSYLSTGTSKILKSGKVAFEDFYWNDQDRRIYMKIVVPIFEKRSGNWFKEYIIDYAKTHDDFYGEGMARYVEERLEGIARMFKAFR